MKIQGEVYQWRTKRRRYSRFSIAGRIRQMTPLRRLRNRQLPKVSRKPGATQSVRFIDFTTEAFTANR